MDSRVGSSGWQHSEEDLAAAEATIQGTLRDILLKESQEDSGKSSLVAGMRPEFLRTYANYLLGEPSWKALSPESRGEMMKERERVVKHDLWKLVKEWKVRAERSARDARSESFSKRRTLKSKRESMVRGRKFEKRSHTSKSKKKEKAQHEEAGRPQQSVAQAEEAEQSVAQAEEAGRPQQSVAEAEEAVADTSSEGSEWFTQDVSENELGERLQMMEIRPEMQLYADEDYYREATLRALLDIKDKLTKKKTNKDTLLLMLPLLKGMSNTLDQGGYGEEDEIDKGESAIEACLDTNEGTDTTLVESDFKPAADSSATNSMAIQAETLLQMLKDSSHSINEGTDMTMVETDFKPAADPSPTNSMTRLGHYSIQDDLDRDEMAKKTADRDIDREAKNFANYRRNWEAIWSKTCGSFEHMTALSSMQFTSYAPRCSPSNVSIAETLQIFSIKLAKIPDDVGWPLSVYGMVAVRDVVDHNRNFLFYCDRDNSQELKQNDPFLRLIGPSRAVVCDDKVNFEIKLRVKGTTRSQDKTLITEGRNYRQIFVNGASTICFENCFCKVDLCVQMVRRTTQATILGVQVVNSEQWPFEYGARVACSSLPGKIHVTEDNRVTYVTYPASGELVMVDSKDGAKLDGGDGYLQLSRNVVSVEDQGRLDVVIQTYYKSGGIAAQCLVNFPPRFSKITRKHCSLGGVKVVITVAWSRVAIDKDRVMSVGALVQACGS